MEYNDNTDNNNSPGGAYDDERDGEDLGNMI